MIIRSGYTAPLLEGVLWIPRNPLNFGNHYHWMSGMVWYGTQETHTPEFLTRARYMTFYFISFTWRSCLKILFQDFIQYKGHYREKKLWLKLINSKELKALLLKTRGFWMKNDIISSPFLILKIYFEDLFWKYILSVLKQHPSNLQILISDYVKMPIWWY